MRLWWAIFAGFASASVCWADYLPAIGPGPLHFDTKTIMVPIPITNTVSKTTVSTVPLATDPSAKAPNLAGSSPTWEIDWFATEPFAYQPDPMVTIESKPPAGAITNYARSGMPILEPPDPALELVTPQMMVHFFQPSTNMPLASIPILFVPPQPPPRPSSRATSQVLPPEGKQ
jgi:hypothetical protein